MLLILSCSAKEEVTIDELLNPLHIAELDKLFEAFLEAKFWLDTCLSKFWFIPPFDWSNVCVFCAIWILSDWTFWL
ncbi:MAG: hypothetical protein ACRC42_01575 [Mycoplasma sp.]